MSLQITKDEINMILEKLERVDNELDCFNDNFSDWEDQMYDIERALGRDDYDVRFGASKMAIVPRSEDINYVIKIPFHYNGDIYCGSYTGTVSRYDSNRGEWYHTYTHIEGEGSEFEWAEYPITGGNGWDYCQSEAEFYEVAKQYGIDDMFAETRYIGQVNGQPVYVQEKCEALADVGCSQYGEVSDETIASYDSAVKAKFDEYWNGRRSYSKDRTYGFKISRDFELALADSYSIETLLKFFDFSENERVGDFHGGNVGFFCGSHKPCVFDYSGYWD